MAIAARIINDVLSVVVFTLLDLLDVFLCLVYKLADYVLEAEWKPCYCSSARDMILVAERSGSKVLSLISSTKLQLEDISDTLYSRSSLVGEVSKTTLNELCKLKLFGHRGAVSTASARVRSSTATATTFTTNSTIIHMLQGKIGGHKSHAARSWIDCGCESCTRWSSPSGSRDTLFVHAEDGKMAEEDVLFIHGFISSSAFWTETVFPNLSETTRSRYRLFAVDLLGFGKSPKPPDSLYTLREHVDMIERSVLDRFDVKSFHIVAHSLGSILALALAVKHPGAVKSLTILSPVILSNVRFAIMFHTYVKRGRVALRFGSRIFQCPKGSRRRSMIRTYLMDGFFCHTHNSSWHTFHNIICGSAAKVDGYLDVVREKLSCDVIVFHGRDDELLPIDCSHAIQSKVPRARVRIVDDKDHITIVVGRQKAFAGELEEIWNNAMRRYYKPTVFGKKYRLRSSRSLYNRVDSSGNTSSALH
ncbi:hypothetical protein B296_00044276 [Ensete ventricosum]|uniref:AB hydrolase-1 domain-containing protein n=1 Tax=Ensete ventricosum TaxID=4639 RepID=A0A426Z2N6_ENSVE|nr:hypothetical protein B296_00044276 [Ensete ventricosum]